MDSLPPPPPSPPVAIAPQVGPSAAPQVGPSAAPQAAPSAAPQAAPSTDAPRVRYGFAPGDIYPRGAREAELCEAASTVDWEYFLGLAVLDTGAVWLGTSYDMKYTYSEPVRYTGPAMIGLTWGATVGAAWLALPKCSMHWVGEAPREGATRQVWPLALSFALLGGVTAPIVNRIADGSEAQAWSNTERVMHVVTAGVFGFAGAFVPYLLPPKTWAAAREIEKLRINASAQGAFVGYVGEF